MNELTKQKEFGAGLLMLSLGVGALLRSGRWEIGSLERMGPGYFPMLLGAGLTILGTALIIESLFVRNAARLELPSASTIRSWVFVILGLASFILAGLYGGFLAAVFCLALISSQADKSNRLKTSVIFSLVLALVSVLTFYFGLRIQFPLVSWG